ncbi:hypothetical protein ACYULU_12450 [Breznakiellaceae bacterium SP9]
MSCIASNGGYIAGNNSFTAGNMSCIASNGGYIASNMSCIAGNMSCIAGNMSCIASNMSYIASNNSFTAGNMSCIVGNTGKEESMVRDWAPAREQDLVDLMDKWEYPNRSIRTCRYIPYR